MKKKEEADDIDLKIKIKIKIIVINNDFWLTFWSAERPLLLSRIQRGRLLLFLLNIQDMNRRQFCRPSLVLARVSLAPVSFSLVLF